MCCATTAPGFAKTERGGGTPAPRDLVDRMDDLNRRGDAAYDSALKNRDLVTRNLLHALGGPVADSLFFGEPFEEPRERPLTKAQLRAMGLPETEYGQRCRRVGMTGARKDFQAIRRALACLGYVDVKEAREFYRHKVEKLVRQHAAAIKRVADALMQHKKLSGAEVKRLIQNKQIRQPIERKSCVTKAICDTNTRTSARPKQ
jgi:hypothetical protein